jgi:hypothetical protein
LCSHGDGVRYVRLHEGFSLARIISHVQGSTIRGVRGLSDLEYSTILLSIHCKCEFVGHYP